MLKVFICLLDLFIYFVFIYLLYLFTGSFIYLLFYLFIYLFIFIYSSELGVAPEHEKDLPDIAYTLLCNFGAAISEAENVCGELPFDLALRTAECVTRVASQNTPAIRAQLKSRYCAVEFIHLFSLVHRFMY
jgi:hypothetical protein